MWNQKFPHQLVLKFFRPQTPIVVVFRKRILGKTFWLQVGPHCYVAFPKSLLSFMSYVIFFCIMCHEHTHPPALNIGKAVQSTQTSECQVIIGLLKPAKACHYLTEKINQFWTGHQGAFSLWNNTKCYSSFQSEGFERRPHFSCLQWQSSPVAVCLCFLPHLLSKLCSQVMECWVTSNLQQRRNKPAKSLIKWSLWFMGK